MDVDARLVDRFFDGALATDPSTLAFAAFLARYRGSTRHSYAADLRDWVGWCSRHQLAPLEVKRAHVELYLRDMEENRKLARATVARRLTTLTGFYRVAVIDGAIPVSPAESVVRPHRPEESSTLGLSHLKFEAILAAARADGPIAGALISMLGLPRAADLRSVRRRRR